MENMSLNCFSNWEKYYSFSLLKKSLLYLFLFLCIFQRLKKGTLSQKVFHHFPKKFQWFSLNLVYLIPHTHTHIHTRQIFLSLLNLKFCKLLHYIQRILQSVQNWVIFKYLFVRVTQNTLESVINLPQSKIFCATWTNDSLSLNEHIENCLDLLLLDFLQLETTLFPCWGNVKRL